MSELTAGPAIECDEDGVTPISERDAVDGVDECPFCEEPGTVINLVECVEGGPCEDEEHDFGTGFHHVRRER